MRVFLPLWHLPRNVLRGAITLYQHTLSPDHGLLRVFFPDGCCIYAETCSTYAKRVIGERGAVIGSMLAIRRVLSCHPWQKLSDEQILNLAERKKQ